MLSIFIMLIIAIALCAGIGYSIFTLIKSGESSLTTQKNQVRLEVMAAAIRAGVIYRDGKPLVPVKIEGSTVSTEFPEGLVPFMTTVDGRPVTYCAVGAGPFDGNVVTETIEINGISRTYLVSGALTGEDAEEIGEALHERGIVAFLISPEPKAAETPNDCTAFIRTEGEGDEIEVFPDHLVIEGGVVTPVYAFATPLVPESDLSFVIEADSEEPNAPVTDEDVDNAAEQWAASNSFQLTLEMPEIKSVHRETIEKLVATGSGRVLRINGSPDSPAVIRVFSSEASGTLEIAYRGDVFMENVIFEGWSDPQDSGPSFDIVLVAEKPARLFLENVVTGGLKAKGGKIALSGPGSLVIPEFGASSVPVVVNGGEVFIAARNGGSASSIIASAADSLVRVNGGLLVFEGKPRFETGLSARIVEAFGNARIAATPGPVMASVVRDGGPAADEIISQSVTVKETCATGDGSCTATCEAGRVAVSGSCASSDGHALAGFGVDPSATSFTCVWSAPIASLAPMAPSATAVCQ